MQSKFNVETEIPGKEEGLPPDSIAVFEKLVYNMRSQESRDTGNLCIGKQKNASLKASGDTHENKWLRHLELGS